MNTFVLNAETSGLSIKHLLKQVEAGGGRGAGCTGKSSCYRFVAS